MRNIFDLLWRMRTLLLFLLLEGLAMLLIVRHNGYQRSVVLSAAGGFSAGIQQRYDNVMYYFSLKEANAILERENAYLRNRMQESFIEDSRLVFFRNDTLYRQRYEYVPARVIRSTFNKAANYMVINKGSADGVLPDMGVIAPDGVAGIVHSVSEHYASVLSLLHKDIRISARILGNGYVGTFRWNTNDAEHASLEEIPAHVRLHAGDSVVTSGYSMMFPAGLPLGVIDTFDLQGADHFYTIRLRLCAAFRKMDHVYVIRDLEKYELDKLDRRLDE